MQIVPPFQNLKNPVFKETEETTKKNYQFYTRKALNELDQYFTSVKK